MAASSLVVRISADLSDFSKNLNKMTKDVREAAQSVSDIGKAMTIGITLPVAIAVGALAKMALENEEVANKMTSVFGPAVGEVNAQLERMMEIVPVTMTELQKFSIKTTELGRGLGMTDQKASLLSTSIMAFAGNLSASKSIEFAEALDVAQSALLGKTKGLKNLGIVLDENMIKQEAYRLNLLRSGEALTPLGKALATYSLLSKKNVELEGEAMRVRKDAATQWKFLKRDLLEFADATSNLLLPAIRGFLSIGRTMVNLLNAMPDGLREAALTFGILAAAIGPALIMFAKVTEAIIVLRSAMLLLAAGGALQKFIGLLLSPKILLVMAAIAVAAGGAAFLWKKFSKEVKKDVEDLPDMIDIASLLGGATSADERSPFAKWKEEADALINGFEQGVSLGDPLVATFAKVVALNKEALGIYDQQANKWGEMAQHARDVMIKTAAIMAVTKVASGSVRGVQSQGDAIKDASRTITPQSQINFDLARQLISDETSLRVRESALRIADVFDATRNAAVEMGEQFRYVQRDFSVNTAKLKASWGSMSGLKEAVVNGAKQGLNGIMQAFDPMTIAMTAIGKIFQGFEPVLSALMEPLIMLGKIIGIMITPVLRVLFVPLKYLGIVVSLIGEVFARVTAGIATGIGKLLVGIGNLVNKLPGSMGNGVKRAGEAMLGFASDQYEAADLMKRTRKELQEMKFGDTANGIDKLNDAAREAAESILGLPDIFKINLVKFNAEKAIDYNTPRGNSVWSPVMSPSMASGNGAPAISDDTKVANINLDGRTVASITWGHIRQAAHDQFGDSRRVTDVTKVR